MTSIDNQHKLADLASRGNQNLTSEQLQAASGVRSGVFKPGERAALTDPKGKRHSLLLTPGAIFHTTKGALSHDDIIGKPEGITVTTVSGLEFLVTRNLLCEQMVSMPRQAAVIYPKDAGQIVMWTDIFPGARVLEAGVGSGALSMALLRAIGASGTLTSYEIRPEFAERARANVAEFFGEIPPNWQIVEGDLAEVIKDEPVDRVVLDMLAPWDCLAAVSSRLVAGGMLCCYVTTTTQMAHVMDAIRVHGEFTEPVATETLVRQWHAEGLAVRPAHAAGSHTGFLVTARRMAPGYKAPRRRRRPAPGAYGPDYHGPVPDFGLAENQ